MKLYEHQQKGIDFIKKCKGKAALFWDMGTGKTCTALSTFKVMREYYPKLKMIVLCPLTLIEAAWKEDTADFTDYKFLNLRKMKKKEDPQTYDVLCTNYETMISSKRLAAFRKVIEENECFVVLDECFSGETLVDTPNGTIKIKNIRSGDKIYNCTGIDTVVGTSIKKLDSWVKIRYNKVTIKCSLNHPFLTREGWKNAKDIKRGDFVVSTRYSNKILCSMQRRILPLFQKLQQKNEENVLYIKQYETVLRDSLLSEMADAAARNSGENIYQRSRPKNIERLKKNVCKWLSSGNSQYRTNTKVESDKRSSRQKKDIRNIKKNGMETGYTRGEWKRINCSSIETFKTIGWIMASRICTIFRKEERGLSDPLQNRYSTPQSQNRDRSRWIIAYFKKTFRHKKRQNAREFRVDDIEIYKQGNNGKSGDGPQKNLFYDLRIKNHPSFSVNEVLVHNSSRIKNHKSDTYKNLIKMISKMKFRVVMSGTPCPNSYTELWTQINFIKPGLLPESFNKFRNKYFYLGRGDQKMQVQGYMPRKAMAEMFKKGWTYKISPQMRDEFFSLIAPWTYWLKKEDCLDLPETVDEIRLVEMTVPQKKAYKEMKRDLITWIEDNAVTAQVALTKLMKLRQITSNFLLTEDHEAIELGPSNPKFKALEELLEDIGDKPVIIWAVFKKDITYLTEKLAYRKSGNLYSGTIDKQDTINKFKSGEIMTLICNPQSVAHGLTLVNCSYSIYYSLDYSWENYIQSKNRIHRIGQKNKCTYIHLLADNSIDQMIYQVLGDKDRRNEILSEFMRGRIK